MRARQSRLVAEALALLGVIQTLNGDIYGMMGGYDWSEMSTIAASYIYESDVASGRLRVVSE